MKRSILMLLTIFALVLSLSGCGIRSGSEEDNQISESPADHETTGAITEPKPGRDRWTWQHDIPDNHSLDTERLEAFHAQLASTQVFASVIIKDGYIVDEYYKDGYDATSVFSLHSCSKSITGALIGIAIDQGLIESVDVPISEYFPQILDSDSEYLKQITIRHLLTHSSGISWNESDIFGAWRRSENWVNFVLNQPFTTRPGTTFNYSTGGSHLLAAILQEATGRTVYDFGKEYLFEPLGMDSVRCGTDAQGVSDGGNGFSMNVYDLAKFGRLFLNDGVWEGQRIISKEWVAASTSVQFTRSSGGTAHHGYQWWVRTFGVQGYHAYFAQGHFGQFIFVIPHIDLIMVFTSRSSGSSDMYWEFVADIVAACG